MCAKDEGPTWIKVNEDMSWILAVVSPFIIYLRLADNISAVCTIAAWISLEILQMEEQYRVCLKGVWRYISGT